MAHGLFKREEPLIPASSKARERGTGPEMALEVAPGILRRPRQRFPGTPPSRPEDRGVDGHGELIHHAYVLQMVHLRSLCICLVCHGRGNPYFDLNCVGVPCLLAHRAEENVFVHSYSSANGHRNLFRSASCVLPCLLASSAPLNMRVQLAASAQG